VTHLRTHRVVLVHDGCCAFLFVLLQVFHWESQNATSPESVTGRRYINHKSLGAKVLLFTRPRQWDENGITMPYTCLGQVDYMSQSGSKPVGIVWKLHRAMPADVYVEASAVAQ
jgi:hypothetical protein